MRDASLQLHRLGIEQLQLFIHRNKLLIEILVIDELAGLFVQVLELATEMKLLKLDTVCLDGTKMHANASRHSALLHDHIVKPSR